MLLHNYLDLMIFLSWFLTLGPFILVSLYGNRKQKIVLFSYSVLLSVTLGSTLLLEYIAYGSSDSMLDAVSYFNAVFIPFLLLLTIIFLIVAIVKKVRKRYARGYLYWSMTFFYMVFLFWAILSTFLVSSCCGLVGQEIDPCTIPERVVDPATGDISYVYPEGCEK